MTLFGGNLDVGKTALNPSQGQFGGGIHSKSLRNLAQKLVAIHGSRAFQGSLNSPFKRANVSHPTKF